jgi:MYXO-CTERM domain-containing protein
MRFTGSPSAITIAAAAIGMSLTTADSAVAGAVFADFTSGAAGTLNGVGFTISGALDASDTTWDLNDAAWEFAGVQDLLAYNANSSITITFDTAISDLEFYVANWRNSGIGGYPTYTFDQSFTIDDDFSGATQVGNNLNLSGNWASGIIRFTDPVSSLTFAGAGGSGSDSGHLFTLGQTAGSSTVPGGGGLVAMAGAGLAGWRRRR